MDITQLRETLKVDEGVDYEIYNEQKEKLNFGTTSLVFIDKNTRKPMKGPDKLIEQLKEYIK